MFFATEADYKAALLFDRKIRRRCVDLVRRVVPGSRIYWAAPQTGFTWNGSELYPSAARNVGRGPRRRFPDLYATAYQLHDVVHVLLASEERRRVPECGLGPDPFNVRTGATQEINSFRIAEEEAMTCHLQLALLALWEFPLHVMASAASQIRIERIPTVDLIKHIGDYRPDALPDMIWRRLIKMPLCGNSFSQETVPSLI